MSDKRAPLVPLVPGVAGRAIQEADKFVRRGESVDHTHGVEVAGVILTSGTTTRVVHKLGRKPKGYRVERIQAGSPSIYETEPPDDRALMLYSEFTVKVDLWVY